jgi:hypothetical protein
MYAVLTIGTSSHSDILLEEATLTAVTKLGAQCNLSQRRRTAHWLFVAGSWHPCTSRWKRDWWLQILAFAGASRFMASVRGEGRQFS